jgi:hypothetical protein
MQTGLAGLAQGNQQSMLHVSNLLTRIWSMFKPVTICRCWIAAGILNAEQDSLLDNICSKNHNQGTPHCTPTSPRTQM